MTSNNHSALALAVAVQTEEANPYAKILLLIGLFLSHFPADFIPHWHFYDIDKLRRTWPGAIVELGGGFVFLPLVVWWISGLRLGWLYACVMAANLFDFGLFIKIFRKCNNFLHYHFLNLPDKVKQWSELAETALLLSGLIISLKLS